MGPPDRDQTYRYVAFIDEAGDDGLRSVKPIDPNGGTEWFILSAVVIRASRESEPRAWVRDILRDIGSEGAADLHFNRLSPNQKTRACELISELPLKCFVVASNKKNMRHYLNKKAAKVPSRNFFYCWMTRLLLERVTEYCSAVNDHEDAVGGKVKFVFSESHRMSYRQFRAYLHWIKLQSIGGSLHLDKGDPDWSVVDIDLVEAHPHKTRAGLMLADVVASAFFQGVTLRDDQTCRPEYAKLLAPRIARKNATTSGFGLKAMPPQLYTAALTDAQAEVFNFYGVPTRRAR
ncbi:hypothetical protein BV511_07680 [Methylorubrum extorquens]|uniref:DUF3800 domain-containing protein n=1 Tax=Methylorubrum extorquens TaxID=408 RepID=UPI00097277AB|nr:hypothetical protein BV511_07680 [Methylorubrum extorquens]